MRTWLLVAAERGEFAGILKRFGAAVRLSWTAEFAYEARHGGDRFLMIANGPGSRLVEKALEKKIEVDGIISTGFCGALDESLRVGDIVIGAESGLGNAPGVRSRDGLGPRAFANAEVVCIDRVIVTAGEKRALRQKTGAAAVEMESAAVAAKAAEWGVPFRLIRAVSDEAAEDLPLDFNLYRDAEGRFSRGRIALAALARPFTRVPALLRLDRNTKVAARSLGDYFADCRL
jgi:adenosylhomocysteine nucleosidase